MQLNEDTLTELGKQFGIMINWTNEQAVPYLKDLAARVIAYETYQSIFWIAIASILILTFLVIMIVSFKKHVSDDAQGFCVICFAVIFIVGIIIIGCQINDIILCQTIPEKIILRYIKG